MIGLVRRGNLRLRAAVGAGLLTTLSIIVVGVSVWLTVALSLRNAADADLRNTTTAIRTMGVDAIANDLLGPTGPESQAAMTGAERPAVPYIQIIGPNGDVVGAPLPLDDAARSVIEGREPDGAYSVTEIDGRMIRVLTVALDPSEGGGALQVGTDFTSLAEGLERARAWSTLVAVLAGLAAAAASWVVAGQLLAPVAAVANAADRLRRNDELPDDLEGEGDDELGRLVTSFNELLDDLRVSRDRQRRLVADVSHELRTPLTSLRVKIEFIKAEPDLATSERERLLEGAVADLGSLGDLVSELVELASEGASPERSSLIDLAALVNSEVERFGITTGREVEVHTTPGMVETRPKQAARALSNLLVNADKYSPRSEPIAVRQRGPRIEVRDRGPGIPVEDRDRVFERFYRGDADRSVDGTGLGLAIVAAVARSNGGTTWVKDPDDGEPGVVVGLSVGPTAPDSDGSR